ncbi:hypothetical protein QQF21_17305 [Lelliottia sp. V89_10]|uniref:hypothetical protein n=1 Tax=Lelliottia wanjuensis TaxID=3050585 RepID=UPI00249DFB13|nr:MULTISPECIES: hypothetical protein [unclassified Lelliottia]MDI3359791.1 hypothetical protein [Lelliottia sp. V89_13]MDK9548749.1 hypothetical protein [Lelliottia sp. V89_5]MDK9597381.1 hypothetical protein [Lelliottia sp. V89_10]
MFNESNLLQINLLNCFLESEDISPDLKQKITNLALEKTRATLDPLNQVHSLIEVRQAVQGSKILDGLSLEQITELKQKSMGY